MDEEPFIVRRSGSLSPLPYACKEKGAQGQAPLGQHWGKPRDVGPCQVLLTD